jgi:hypothetical protein
MNPFQDNIDGANVITQPFQKVITGYDRRYSLQESDDSRTADRSNTTALTNLGIIFATEPQLVQRVTTNLIAVDESVAMQIGAFLIYTDNTPLDIDKGDILFDHLTEKKYKVISFYKTGLKYKLMVIELND